jgi:hypothetical protein
MTRVSNAEASARGCGPVPPALYPGLLYSFAVVVKVYIPVADPCSKPVAVIPAYDTHS